MQVQSLSKVYATDDGPVRALDHVSLDQKKGEFVSIVGPKRMRQEHAADDGRGSCFAIRWRCPGRGKAVNGARKDIGIVFQDHVLLDWRDDIGQRHAAGGDRASST